MPKIKKIITLAIFGFILSASFVLANGDTGQRDLPIRLSNFLGFTTISGLPEYISRIYNIMIGLAGGIASFMMIVAGFQYVTAHGDKGKIDKAVKRIENSIVGLFLVFGAYLILNTINPALLSLKLPEIKTIARIKLEFISTKTPTMTSPMPGYVKEEVGAERTCTFDNEMDCNDARLCAWDAVRSQCGVRGALLFSGRNGEGCRIGADSERCDEGLECINLSSTEALCSNHRNGSPCLNNPHCIEPPNTCFNHLCLTPTNRPSSAPCSNNSQCESGRCSSGTCSIEEGISGGRCRGTIEDYDSYDNRDLCSNENLFCCQHQVGGRTECEFLNREEEGCRAAAELATENTCMAKMGAITRINTLQPCIDKCTANWQCLSNRCIETVVYNDPRAAALARKVCSCNANYRDGASDTDEYVRCPSDRPVCIEGLCYVARSGSGSPCTEDADCGGSDCLNNNTCGIEGGKGS